ncbi:hypothetical protein N7448_002643 [Penicillium atrosanguineum]|nr:hypothetical protein N7526_007100 [Penicillium atrosanguineum]KAJ5145251.1 hypothetical protein N7448_002643 [Penicillium atrosanguineum]
MAPPMDNTTRGVILGLKMAGKGNTEIAEIIGMTPSAVSMLYLRAVKKGYDPEKRPLGALDSFFGGGSTPNTPKKRKTPPAEEAFD